MTWKQLASVYKEYEISVMGSSMPQRMWQDWMLRELPNSRLGIRSIFLTGQGLEFSSVLGGGGGGGFVLFCF